MPAQLTLDPTTVARLAAADPALAHLPLALPDAGPDAVQPPHDVAWRAGSGCRLAYRRRSGDGPPAFDAVIVTADGWSRHDFRDDPALPGLRSAADPTTAGALLGAVVGRHLGPVRVEPVRYRPGSRCVLRYSVATPDGSRTFYGKVLAEDAFARLLPLVTALAAHPGWAGLGPPLAAVWPELRTLVSEAAPAGSSASSVLGDPRRSPEERTSLARRVGELLARVHDLQGLTPPRWTAADQVAALRGSVGAPAAVDRALGDRLTELIDRLETRLPAADGDVLSHGGFRAGQVVVGFDGTLTLLDLDGLSLSDRGRDLGTAVAQVFWQRLRGRLPGTFSAPVEEALLAGYRARAGVAVVEALPWWRAAGLLQVAVRRFGRLETSDWPAVPRVVEAAGRLVDDWESRPIAVTGTDLLDVTRMSSLLAPLLGGRAAGGPSPALTSARRLSVAEGRRTVVRYTVEPAAGDVPGSVIAKAFAETTRARWLDETLRLLSGGPFRQGGLRVPEPLGVVAAERLVLLRESPGRPLSELTGPEALAGVRRASDWLVRLHTSGVRLPRELSVADEARTALQWARSIGRAHPDLRGRALSLATAWAEAALSAPPPGRRVALHKDFHAGHVLLGAHVCVIDLDEARHGDPAFDLAHFCTYLEAVVDGRDRTSLRDAFLHAYADATGWSDEGSFGPYCAYTWLKVAKQRAAGGGPFPAAPPALRSAHVERAITEGERCLHR
jgi:aminoglycoside phosphotransferase (APT) family kinase protein